MRGNILESRHIKILLKIVVTIGLVVILIPKIDWKQFSETMASIDVLLFCFYISLGVIDRWLMAFKWTLLLKIKHINISNLQSLNMYMVGGFFGEFLPAGVGLDLYRIRAITKQGHSLKNVASAVVAERILGFSAAAALSFTAMGIVGVVYDNALLPYAYPLFIVCILSVAVLIIMVNRRIWNYVSKLLNRYHSNKLLQKAKSFYKALMEFKETPLTLWIFVFLSVIEVALKAVFIYIGSRAFGFEVEFIYFIALVPTIFILLKIPISIQGIGVQEGLFIFFFSLAGMASTDAFSLAFILRVGAWTLALMGAFIYISNGLLVPRKA